MDSGVIQALEVAAIVVAGTMTGNEIAVAVFFHPRISRLDDAAHSRAAQTLASALGAVMPFWYALTFLLSLAVTFIGHTAWSESWWLALGATVLWALMIIYSLLLPVPITRLPGGNQNPCQPIGGSCGDAGIRFMQSELAF